MEGHVGHWRVSIACRWRFDSLTQESPSLKGKGRRIRESGNFTEVSVPLSPFSTNTTLITELQDFALAIAVCLTSEARDASYRQCFLPTHNPPISQYRASLNSPSVPGGGSPQRSGLCQQSYSHAVCAPARVGPRICPALAAAPSALSEGARRAVIQDRICASAPGTRCRCQCV